MQVAKFATFPQRRTSEVRSTFYHGLRKGPADP